MSFPRTPLGGVTAPDDAETIAALERALGARLAHCRDRVMGAAARACETSERGVLAAGAAVEALYPEAKEQTDELGRAACALEGEQGVRAVASLLAEQSELCQAFLGRTASDLRDQNEQLERTAALTSAVARAGLVIRDVADQTRILTVNALIEAARLGEQGRSVAVIAKEMGELSKSVRAANEQISELVQSLVAVLPSLAERSRRLVADSEAFSARAARDLEHAGSTSDALGAMVADSLATRERRLRRVLSLSQGALSSLQFQDPMAQELRALDACFDDLEADALSALAAAHAGHEASAPFAPRRPEPDSGESPALDDGEVLFFSAPG
jgi:hypothetical protein